jgi:hypothetical protein
MMKFLGILLLIGAFLIWPPLLAIFLVFVAIAAFSRG